MRLSEYANLKRNDWVAYDDIRCQVAAFNRKEETLQLKYQGKRLGWHSYLHVGLSTAPVKSNCLRCSHLCGIKYDAEKRIYPLHCKLLNSTAHEVCHDYKPISVWEYLKRRVKYFAINAYFRLYGKVTKIMQK